MHPDARHFLGLTCCVLLVLVSTVKTEQARTGSQTAEAVTAIVRGDSGAVYLVRHLPGQWSCSCTAAPYAGCSHLRAVRLITAPAGPVVLAPDLMVGGTA